MSLDKDIDQIEESDLLELIDHGIIEKKTLEYKMQLPGNSDADKKEFLADVSSLANASGGHIIYGIAEGENGAAASIPGLDIENPDKEIQRLDSIIRDSIEPRIPGFIIKEIILSNSKYSLIIKVPRSWIGPHRVTFKGHDKFYGRSSNGKYPLDVTELRTAFTLSETIIERIRRFREDRISSIYANDLPVLFEEGAKIVLHIIPISSFNPGQRHDFPKQIDLAPIFTGQGYQKRYNFDGVLWFSGLRGSSQYISYIQLYRNGIIEFVDGALLMPMDSKKSIPSIHVEKALMDSLDQCLSFFKTFSVDPPCFVFITLLDVKGYELEVSRHNHFIHQRDYKIERDVLILPESLIEDYNVHSKNVLKPAFDTIWNACGYERSLNYD